VKEWKRWTLLADCSKVQSIGSVWANELCHIAEWRQEQSVEERKEGERVASTAELRCCVLPLASVALSMCECQGAVARISVDRLDPGRVAAKVSAPAMLAKP